MLQREADDQVVAGKLDAVRPLELSEAAVREWLPEWPSELRPSVSMPLRPAWSYDDTQEKLDAREASAFVVWEETLVAEHGAALSRYERNLDVWRQLWRTLEVSDALLLIVDIRTPLLSFPAPLYNEAVRRGLPCICLLNKADLVPLDVAEAWAAHLRTRFPRLAAVLLFRADPGAPPKGHTGGGQRRQGYRRWRAGGEAVRGDVRSLLETIRGLPVLRGGHSRVFADFWSSPGSREAGAAAGSESESEREDDVEVHTAPTLAEELASGGAAEARPYVTLGVVGEPNMGKSAVINRLFARPVVKASPTPGCTKHLQTLFLRPLVRLADCPGLVFPKTIVHSAIQLLCGNTPIAQAREPFGTVRYLAESGVYPPLQRAYALSLDDVAEHSCTAAGQWSPFALCEALARKRSLITRGGAPDVHRAANRLLRDALSGRNVRLAFVPPGAQPQAWPPGFCQGAALGDESSEDEKEAEAEKEAEEEADAPTTGAFSNPFDAFNLRSDAEEED